MRLPAHDAPFRNGRSLLRPAFDAVGHSELAFALKCGLLLAELRLRTSHRRYGRAVRFSSHAA